MTDASVSAEVIPSLIYKIGLYESETPKLIGSGASVVSKFGSLGSITPSRSRSNVNLKISEYPYPGIAFRSAVSNIVAATSRESKTTKLNAAGDSLSKLPSLNFCETITSGAVTPVQSKMYRSP